MPGEVLRPIANAMAFGGLTAAYAVPALALAPFSGMSPAMASRVSGIAGGWARSVVTACGIGVDTQGFDRPLPEPSYLVLANHTSYFDVVAIFARFPRDLHPVAKRELGYIPIFGWALRAGAAIMIDRGDPERARASLEAAGAAIRAGRSVLMFPEGTRTASPQVRPFKKGPFYLALAARVPILPIAVQGASDVLRPGDWRIHSGRRIRLCMGDPIPTDTYTDDGDGRRRLSEAVRVSLQSLLDGRDAP